MAQAMTNATPDEQLCYHCGLQLDPQDCGRAEVEAHWLDEEGQQSDETYMVCRECLAAGSASGPGYRAVQA